MHAHGCVHTYGCAVHMAEFCWVSLGVKECNAFGLQCCVILCFAMQWRAVPWHVVVKHVVLCFGMWRAVA